ncbi:MAG: lipid-A-disaccharide synthase [Prevotellaceae bacterium]|jgi:lipid-A-disaccharide synthase|nr:lipid-A-disaccharide synthase [Prevotellaceae bacterium]
MKNLAYIVTGEPSGDVLASRLIQALRRQRPDIRFAGVGGETMAALGFESLFSIAETSVMGLMEVAPKLPLILRRVRQVVADIEARQPAVLVTVDSWGFVSAILGRLRRRGSAVPVVNYVAPQVWAWKKGRARTAAKLIDRLMALWPYEPPYFERYGLRCDFVGHPIVEQLAGLTDDLSAFKVQHGIPPRGTLLCVLPGSRSSEVKRLAPVFKSVVGSLAGHFPDLFVVVPSVAAIAPEMQRAFADMPTPHCIIVGQRERYNAFRASSFAIAASGTVTLELATCGVPHVIAYTFNPLTNRVADLLVKTKYANLINIMASEFVIPEFTLSRCRADLIYPAALALMQQPEAAQAQVAAAQRYFAQLKPEGMMPSDKAASVVLEAMEAMDGGGRRPSAATAIA